jgi:hypothetical protein
MTSRLVSSLWICSLAAACGADPASGTDTPARGGAGSPPTTSAGTGNATGGQSGQAGQAPSTGGTAAGIAGVSGAAGTSGQAGSSSGAGGGSGSSNGGSAGANGGGPHAGDGCVPGGTGFDTSFADVVLDRATCLVWQRKDPARDMASCALMRADIPSALCWSAAQAYCDGLALDGQSDWRLPTVSELQTIIASPPPTGPVVPTVDHDAFPEAVANLYWSSESSGGKVHCADFNGGPPTSNTGPDGPQALRCVRGAAP